MLGDNDDYGFRAEIRDVVRTLGAIREEVAALRADMVWVKSITEGVCADVGDLQAFKWRLYGMSAGISLSVSVFMYFLKG